MSVFLAGSMEVDDAKSSQRTECPIGYQSFLSPEVRPIDLWDTVGPPSELPLGILPKVVEDFSIVMSRHMGASASDLAMSALTVMAAAIPDRIKLQVKKHSTKWLESAHL